LAGKLAKYLAAISRWSASRIRQPNLPKNLQTTWYSHHWAMNNSLIFGLL
jgi:hypothetical protein